MSLSNIIAADLGNSRIKLMTEDNVFSVEYSDNWIKNIKRFIPDNSKVFYSSVNSEQEEILLESNEISEVIDFINVKTILEKEEHIKYKHIKGIGVDRVLGMLGATYLSQPPLITVDCGTAVTVNALDSNNTVLGGAIFSGVYSQLNTLLNNTNEISQSAGVINERNFLIQGEEILYAGKNTADALKSGIFGSVVGGIKYVTDKIISKHFNNKNVKIIITGGYGNIIAEELKSENYDVSYIQSLILEGIFKIAK